MIESHRIPFNMPIPTNIGTLITTTPGVCGGRPCIAGSRITVQYIITEIKAGITPEEILEDKPFLSLASIHAAIAPLQQSNLLPFNQSQIDIVK